MDDKLEKHFQIAEKENKELILSYFTDSKMSIFSQQFRNQLSLMISGIVQSLWTWELSQ